MSRATVARIDQTGAVEEAVWWVGRHPLTHNERMTEQTQLLQPTRPQLLSLRREKAGESLEACSNSTRSLRRKTPGG